MTDPVAQQIMIDLAVEGWQRPAAKLYAPGHALLLQLFRLVDPGAAAALHDANARKPLALSPLAIEPVDRRLARARLTVRVWSRPLIDLLDAVLRESLAIACDVQGRPAIILGYEADPVIQLSDLLLPRPTPTTTVRFTSPTFFSVGRRFGRQQYMLLPVPDLTVDSWLRAWLAAGGEPFDVERAPGWLGDRVGLREVRNLQTIAVNGGKTALTGFVGEATYAWLGPEPWGPQLLAALARFAAYCGTGAKTGYGFGVTVPQGPQAAEQPRATGTAMRSGAGYG